MKFAALLLVATLLAACHPRTSLYAPRREGTPEHRQARIAADCLECHDLSRLRGHQPDDDCFRCHKICEAY